jgi:hypothetical protein
LSNLFDRLHRLRHLEERTARVEHALCARERDDRQAEVIQLEDRMERSRAAAADTASVQHRDAWLLHAEMERRRRDGALRQAEAQFLFTQGVLRERAIEARSAELLAESFDARAALALAEAERKELDEIGTQRWLRRAG